MSSVAITPADDSLALTLQSEVKATSFEEEVTVTFNANITAPALANEEHEQRKNVNIVCVIDTSGSMSGEPLRLVRETLDFIVGQLKDGDHLSLVSFGDSAKLLFPLTDMTTEGKTQATERISKLAVDGMTNLSAGLQLGFNQLYDLYKLPRLNHGPSSASAGPTRRSYGTNIQQQVWTQNANDADEPTPTPTAAPETPAATTTASTTAVSSILVLTDGHANRGLAAVPALVDFTATAFAPLSRAASEANGAVSLHSFGFSQGHNPELMTRVAEAGNGVFYYVPSGDKIGDVFADCLGGLLSVIAINVVLEVEVQTTGASITAVNTPFAVTTVEAGRRLRIDVGQMYSEQSRDILIDVKLPKIDASDLDVKVLAANLTSLNRKEVVVSAHAIATIDRVAADSSVLAQQVPNKAVADQKARYETATALKEAITLKTAGRTEDAQQVLEKAKNKLSAYGGYQQQLTTASNELTSANQGYLWGQMRSHYAQSSVAASDLNDEYEAAAPSYSNSKKKAMRMANQQQQAPQQVQQQQQQQQQQQVPQAYGAPQQQTGWFA